MMVAWAKVSGAPGYVVTPNAQHLLLLSRDSRFQQTYNNAFLAVADGVPLIWASRLLGTPLPERVNGTDLVVALCEQAEKNHLRLFFLGGRPGAAQTAAMIMNQRFSRLETIEYYCPSNGFENNQKLADEVIDRVRRARPDLLFVGLGAPKQEYWMEQNCKRVGVPLSIGIGGSFELIAGILPRAPRWVQRCGLEWLFRLFIEPKRLWKRYLVGNAVFVWLVLTQLASQQWARSVQNRG